MAWRAAPAEMPDFAAKHAHLSTSPDSLFVQFLIVQRRDAEGADIMLGLGLRRVDGTDARGKALTRRADWFDALHDVFGLRFDGAEPEALDRLWEKMYAAHVAWEEGKARDLSRVGPWVCSAGSSWGSSPALRAFGHRHLAPGLCRHDRRRRRRRPDRRRAVQRRR